VEVRNLEIITTTSAPEDLCTHMSIKIPKKKSIKVNDAFSFGAELLNISIDKLVQLYIANLDVIKAEINAGKSNAVVGYMGTLKYADILHGGAYAAPVNLRPFWMTDPTKSPYNPPGVNLPVPGWADFASSAASGTSATFWMKEVIWDGNVPHVFPKLLSDECYMMIKQSFAQGVTADLFGKVTTSLSTLVEAGAEVVTAAKSGKGGGFSSSDRQSLRSILVELKKTK
jgi:hypothetical protein